MAQIFPKSLNWLPLVGAFAATAGLVVAVGGVWYYASPEYTDVGYRPHQPVPYSHKLHIGELGLDCRYCHFSVETSPVAVIPPTQTCMNCHHVVARSSEKLEPIRESLETGTPMRWVRVHDLADYAYFNHASHIRVGVGCVSCHGRIDEMEEVMQVEPLSMGWCLDCHRDPAPHLRPTEEVFNMKWSKPANQAEFAARVIQDKQIGRR